TTTCCRCHDHKYDPLTQKEFYRLFAFFNNVPERGKAGKFGNSAPMLLSPTPAQQEELNDLKSRLAIAKRGVAMCRKELEDLHASWERTNPKPSGKVPLRDEQDVYGALG